MATAQKVVSHQEITEHEFSELLSRYPALVEAISQSKGAKNGQKTLSELDHYRYVDALELFGGEKPRREMNLDDVKALVEWKLRHGKFRPSLMNLVSSNHPPFTSKTIQSALKAYRNPKPSSSSLASAALDTLTKLKGIGPATASLLLTVHDPQNVIFFSDEAFYWLCCKGNTKASIKYKPKEYQALQAEAQGLAERLNVSTTDIEKVAYVLMKQQPGPPLEQEDKVKKASSTPVKEAKKPPRAAPSSKRKAASSNDDATGKQKKQKKDSATGDEAAEEQAHETKAPVRRSNRLRK